MTLSPTQLTSLHKFVVWLSRVLTVVLAIAFAYAVPGLIDRRQFLSLVATISATLLGLMLAAAALMVRLHFELAKTPLIQAAGMTRGMTSFWRTATSGVVGLAVSLLASLFGLLDPSGTYALPLMDVAGVGLIYTALFVPVLVGDMWGALAIGLSKPPG